MAVAVAAVGLVSCGGGVQKVTTPGTAKDAQALYEEFRTPGNDARPRVWWHWMQGNITKDGIRKDLEWMKRSGIAGFQNFDAGLSTPQIVDRKLEYMTPEWKDAFHYAAQLADTLDLEMAIAASPGWSQSGGPWVEPQDGMKKVVWREVRVDGGGKVELTLPEPYEATGTFQNISGGEMSFGGGAKEKPTHYEDIAVLAVRLPDADKTLSELGARLTSSSGSFSVEAMTDGDLATGFDLVTAGGRGWLQYEFPESQEVRALSITTPETHGQWAATERECPYTLYAGADAAHLEKVMDVPAGNVNQETVSFEPISAKVFRLTFKQSAPQSYAGFGMGGGPAVTKVAEFVLYPATRINHAEEKAGFGAPADLAQFTTPDAGQTAASEVLDITAHVSDGVLSWDAPEGRWNVIRLGWSLTGHENSPASPEATGLEVDKMDKEAVDRYFDHYLGMYEDATAGLMGERGLQYITTDSYEAGQENWTPAIFEEFKARRGYDLMPWLPVLTGQVVGSSEESEGFLFDWRKTLGELVVDNYYDRLTEILDARGMGRYSESHENGRVYLADGMDVKRTAQIPMAAMWCYNGSGGSTYEMAQADIRESASVAHIYGQNIVAAESMTTQGMSGTGYSFSPEILKPTADLEFASGLNRIVVHTSVHQPVDDKIPGLGLMIFGQWFNRHETWAEQAYAWVDYLSRTSAMLKQGQFVADVAYYYGEDNCVTGLFGWELPPVPQGYSYDFVNSHALLNMLNVGRDGRLVTSSGMSYAILALDGNARTVTPEVLERINALAKAGAVIVGEKPVCKAGLQGDKEAFDKLAEETWALPNVHGGETMQAVLNTLGVKPDFTYRTAEAANLMFVHRTLPYGEIYWVNNREDADVAAQLSFRVDGMKPEIWHAETGEREAATYSMADGVTTVSVDLVPHDAIFVVFAEKTSEASYTAPAKVEAELQALDGPWTVTFQERRGAPTGPVVFETLASLTESADPGIKFFSGAAVYSKTFQRPQADGRVVLDMGDVQNLVEVSVNGKDLGVVWHHPYRIDITDALADGDNTLELKVVTLWRNRLIGDAKPRPRGMMGMGLSAAMSAASSVQGGDQVTYTPIPFFTPDSPLFPAGLIGPVRILGVTEGK